MSFGTVNEDAIVLNASRKGFESVLLLAVVKALRVRA